jgi:hypothetical protein
VAARSKARNVFARSNTGIVGLNSTIVMDGCMCSVIVLPCAGSGLTTADPPCEKSYPLSVSDQF